MKLLSYLVPFAAALGLLILVHELGHYLVARLCGVKVLRFSIGFGKPLLAWRAGRDRTEWALAAFPLGGYVKMLDEREGEVAEHELGRAFNRQSVWRRFAIVLAGPIANFVLAVGLYWGLFAVGTEELRPRVALTEAAASVAAAAGVRDGDLVTAVEQEPVRSWQELRWTLLKQVVDARRVSLHVRTEEGVEAVRILDLGRVDIGDGSEDLIMRLGLRPWRPAIPPVVGRLVPNGAAARAGLQEGDEFVSVGGEPITSWSDLVALVREAPGRPLDVVVRRGDERVATQLTPDGAEENGAAVGRIGVAVANPVAQREAMFTEVSYGFVGGLAKAARQTWEMSTLSLEMIGRMITGEISWDNLSGPVTIADYAGQTARLGLSHYLKFVALISISLGVLNLLPIPVLDGGHLLYYVIEIIKGGPIPERIMEIGQQVGLAILAMLMAFAFYNDINRLISG